MAMTLTSLTFGKRQGNAGAQPAPLPDATGAGDFQADYYGTKTYGLELMPSLLRLRVL